MKIPTNLTSFFWHFIKKQPFSFLILFLSPTAIVLETNVFPYALKMLIDTIAYPHANKNDIIREITPALCIGGTAWFGLIIIMRLNNFVQARAIPCFEADIRMSLVNYIINHSYKYFSDHLAGNVVNKIKDLPKSLESIRANLCWNGIAVFAVVLVTLIIMATINVVFSLIICLWILTHIIITFFFVKRINKISKDNAEDQSILSGRIVDMISNIRLVKLFSRCNYELTYIGSKQKEEQASNKQFITLLNNFYLSIDIAVSIMLGSTFYFLVINWQQNKVSTGDFVFIFNMIFAVMYQMWHLGHALFELFREIGVAQQALTNITQPHQVIDLPNAKPIRITKGEIAFKNVTFGYSKNRNIFKNESLIIKPGQKVGLVGFAGSGKSTFVNLILRFFDLKSGIITIDNQDISKVTQESLRDNIISISQDASLFHRTIIENIRYGRLNAADEEIIRVSKEAYCHKFITQLQDGYNSLVGERGTKLSGGQRQLISIARAMLKDAPICILDEATSSLDSLTETYIQEGLNKLMYGRTAIVIAHRLSTLLKMDRILVFNDGCIVEDGTHEELMNAKGHYALIWNIQAGGPESETIQNQRVKLFY